MTRISQMSLARDSLVGLDPMEMKYFSLVGTISQHLSLTPPILHVIYKDNTFLLISLAATVPGLCSDYNKSTERRNDGNFSSLSRCRVFIEQQHLISSTGPRLIPHRRLYGSPKPVLKIHRFRSLQPIISQFLRNLQQSGDWRPTSRVCSALPIQGPELKAL